LALIDLLTAVISREIMGRKWRWYAELKEQKVRDIETEIHSSSKTKKANTIIVNIPMSYYDYGLLLT
jgi:hypothetical protein